MAAGLERYARKRDFSLTPEPAAGTPVPSTGVLAFVVQKHDATRLHYDFRLEVAGVLKSWAVTRGPSLDPAQKRLAVETEDHPLDYGGFEGAIPKGEYGGGTVMVWDRGTWAMADGKDVDEGLSHGSLSFDLFGERLTGRWHLQRMKAEKGRPPQWLLIKVRDGAALGKGRKDVTERYVRSVASGRTMAQIAEGDAIWHSDRPADEQSEARLGARPPKRTAAGAPRTARRTESARTVVPPFVVPALCRSRTAPPKGEGWLAEVKYDGYRAIVRAADGAVTLLTRSKKDWTHRFPAIAEAAAAFADRDVMLDGEVVVFDDAGRTNFNALQKAFKSAGAVRASYVAFDLLFQDGEDLRDRPIEARKGSLRDLVGGVQSGAIVYGDHVAAGKQAALFEQATALGLEGIIAKRVGSRYRSGRHDDWVKVRAVRTARFVVGGYTNGGASGLGALVVGGWHGDALVPVGRVGTGFTAEQAARLLPLLEARSRKTSPFATPVEERGVTYVRPELVVEVAYLAVTDEGQLRHPVYKGIADVKADDIALPSGHPRTQMDRAAVRAADGGAATGRRGERSRSRPNGVRSSRDSGEPSVEPLGVALSHPDRVLFPEQKITKAALAQHYVAHMGLMMPHIAGRPLTLVRCPRGWEKKCFYQRHPEGLPARMSRDIGEADGAAIVVTEPADVIELVQRGVLEIHLRGARADRPDRPDRLVFDLDPGDGVGFDEVKRAAFTVRDALAELDLVSFVKTTGGKGLHVVVPIERRTPWPEAKAWTRGFASSLAQAEPDRFLITMTKAKRKGRIFIDYLRNDTKSSAVAPYSTRSRTGAPFSVPLTWDQLDALGEPAPFHVGDVVSGAPWDGIGAVRQRLTASLLRRFVD